ncbi:MAG: helix-turn-helix domain-containing protein [bacterium]
MLPIKIILFLLIVKQAYPSFLFESDFERGITVTKTGIKRGAKQIKLIENYRLEEWPVTGGNGIIQGNMPGKKEKFSYKYRKANTLYGVQGIQSSHEYGVDIRTGNLAGWEQISRGICATDTAGIYGSYGCNIHLDSTAERALIKKEIPGLKDVWGRFCVQFDESLIEKVSQGKTLKFQWLLDSLFNALAGFHVVKRGDKILFNFIYYSMSGTRDVLFSNMEVFPDKVYAFRYHFNHGQKHKTSRGCKWWINGEFQGFHRDTGGIELSPIYGTMFGYRDNVEKKRRFDGHIYLDEIVLSDSLLGSLPLIPEISVENGFLIKSIPDTTINSVQWQINRTNSWANPLYNSGEESLMVLKKIPFSYLCKAGDYLWRARFKSCFNEWGHWTKPAIFTATKYKYSASLKGQKPGFLVEEIFLSNIQDGRQILTAIKDKWIWLNVKFSKSQLWSNLSYGLVWISYFQNNIGNMTNKGGPYDKSLNYIFNFSLGDNSVYIKNHEDANYFSEVTGKTRDYVQGDKLKVDSAQKMISIPIKFYKEALSGPWVINACFVGLDKDHSKIRSRSFLLKDYGEPALDKKIPWTITVLFLLFFGFVTLILLRRKKSWEKTEKSFSFPVIKTIKFVKENYTLPDISIKTISEHLNLNAIYLGQLFKKETGRNFSAYVNDLRIKEAKKLLLNSNLKISDICFKLGFNNIEYFSRLFKEIEKITPSQYRKNNLIS